jgi:hypothetical protein
MDVVTRKQAREAKLGTYYTGEPCKHGHLAERYTASGACKDCLKAAQNGVRNPASDGLNLPERQAQRENLVGVKLRIHPLDVATLLDCAVAVTLARHPALVATDVVGARKGFKPEGGTMLYLVNIDLADLQVFRDMQNAMLAARGPNMEAVRARVFGGTMAQAEAARDNGEGEWRFT